MAKEKPVTHHKVRKVGRPTDYTPEIGLRIVNYIQGGSYVETAAAACGIAKVTFYDWLKRSAKEGGFIVHYPRIKDRETKESTIEDIEFTNAIEIAQAEAELFDVGVIGKAAKNGTWQASAWRLERKFPDRYGYKQRMEHSGGIATVNSDGMEAEEKRRIMKELNLLKEDMEAQNERVILKDN